MATERDRTRGVTGGAIAPILADESLYLIGLQVLLDLCGTGSSPARAWASPIDSRRFRVAGLTVAQARAAVLACGDATRRDRLRARLEALLAQLQADGDAPLAFDQGAADVWQSLLTDPLLGDMPQVDRQLYAIAVRQGLVVVEHLHPYSDALTSLTVPVVHP